MATGFQADKGYVREEAVEKFMSRYLEPDLPPAVLYITPYNGREDENPVNAVDPVVIHFSPVMDAGSVTGGKVLVIRKKNQQPVKGTWEIKRKGTYFIFRPELGSFKGRDYLVRLPESVKRSNGVPLDSPIEYSFYIPGNDDTEDDVYGITLIR
ncbi:MAG: Ig-like domain-containing protein [Planctomycetes bacterium]|nr:Ig-like domain-containing protein [Planctomycetota bacterium]